MYVCMDKAFVFFVELTNNKLICPTGVSGWRQTELNCYQLVCYEINILISEHMRIHRSKTFYMVPRCFLCHMSLVWRLEAHE